jgi:DNA-binding CsgD family transcriptional regulator
MTAVASACDGELVPAEAAHVAALGARDAGALEAVATRFGALGAARFGAEAAHAAASLWRAAGDERGLARNQRLEAELRARCQPAAFADGGGAGRSPSVLTPREAEIAALAAEGLASREIARLLGVSVRTVDNHLQHVYVKLGVSNRVALAQAIRRPS